MDLQEITPRFAVEFSTDLNVVVIATNTHREMIVALPRFDNQWSTRTRSPRKKKNAERNLMEQNLTAQGEPETARV